MSCQPLYGRTESWRDDGALGGASEYNHAPAQRPFRTDGAEDLKRWSQTLKQNCAEHLEDLLFLAPWLALPPPARNSLPTSAAARLEEKLATSTRHLPAQLLNHPDPNVAEAAQTLLAADSLYRRARGYSYQALRPELLHQLCWRLVAAIEVDNGKRDIAVIASARALLSEYDEGRTAQAAALKLSHFLGNERRSDLLDPNTAGLHLFVAHIANELEIDQDHVFQLIDIGSSAPFVIMLRAVGIDAERAMAIIYLFKTFALTPRDIGLFDRGFA